MKKELPINLEDCINCQDNIGYRLATILSDDKFMPRYLEVFDSYYIDAQFHFHYDEEKIDALGYFDDVKDTKKITYNNNDLINVIINKINEGVYVLLNYESSYVTSTKENDNKSKTYDVLIYGYDIDLELLHHIIIIDNKIHKQTISFERLKSKLSQTDQTILKNKQGIGLANSSDFSGRALYLNDNLNREPRFDVLRSQIEKCLNGEGPLSNDRNSYGVSIYKRYYEELYNKILNEKDYLSLKGNEHILSSITALMEEKRVLLYKIRYLRIYKFITCNVVMSIEKLYEVINNAFQLLVEYSTDLDVKLLNDAKDKFMEADNIEITILTELSNLFEEYMKIH